MTWWCAASSAPWTWTWRPYPGVWLFVGLFLLLYLRSRSRVPHAAREALWPRSRVVTFVIGVLVLWIALDWPVGALGGYLVSLHTVQYLLLALVAPPLLLAGLPHERLLAADPESKIARFARAAAKPIPALIAYNVVVVVTHIPVIVDGLMASQLGSLLIDVLWLGAGLWLWWPVAAPAGIGRIAPMAKIGYLFLSTIVPTAPAAFLVYADYPVYSLYELAPRVADIGARADHQMGGILMKLAADPIIWIAMAVIFFRWVRAEREADAAAAAARGR